MKITSKSILSPNHPRDTAPMSLPPSLSRRLKTNRSLRGAQSPMFPTAGKKPRSAFDNPEPSSPKVTCIGQVRVKTKKKQGSKKPSIKTGEVSFRKIDSGNPNQKWVHLPLTICEALRGFGAEFSCLFPCRPSCFSTGGTGDREKGGKVNGGDSSCVTVFGRWLVGVQGREIELVVGGEGEGEDRETERGEREFEEGKCEVVEECGAEEVEERRVSICVPPKNALLLMRCRSDPIRVSALVNRFWESPIRSAEEVEEEDEDEGDEDADGPDGERLAENKKVEALGKLVSAEEEKEENPEAEVDDLVMEGQEGAEERENPEAEVHDSAVEVQEEAEERESPEGEVHDSAVEVQGEAEEGKNPEENLEISEELEGDEENDELEAVVVVEEVEVSVEAEENEVSCSVSEAFPDLQRLENEENVENPIEDYQFRESESEEIMPSDEESFLGFRELFSEEEEGETEELSIGEKETQLEEEREEKTQSEETQIELEAIETEEREIEGNGNLEREAEVKKEQENRGERSSLLPECLLLMMCEPKLSMEVSKETWVCSGDFIRWQPERRQVKRTDGCDGPRRRVSIDSTAGPPPAVSMAALIEQKLVNAVAYEPFVLTRCKSEPMRTAAAKLAPETCFWKNRKLERLEPHRRATFGVGAAGVGF